MDEKVVGILSEKSKNINTIMGERRVDAEFVATKCSACGRTTEIEKLKRIMNLSVCTECRKNMESVIC